MYCPNCNANNDEQSVYCSNCGHLLRSQQTYSQPVQGDLRQQPVYRPYNPVNYPAYNSTDNRIRETDSSKNWAGIAGFIMGLIALIVPLTRIAFGVPGLVISIIGRKSENRAMAIAGIVLSVIGLIIGVLFIAAILSIRARTGAVIPFDFASL